MNNEQRELEQYNHALNKGVTMLNKQILELQYVRLQHESHIDEQEKRIYEQERYIEYLTEQLNGKDLQLRDLNVERMQQQSRLDTASRVEEDSKLQAENVQRLQQQRDQLYDQCATLREYNLDLQKQLFYINEINASQQKMQADSKKVNEELMGLQNEKKLLAAKNYNLGQKINKQQAEIIYLKQSLKLYVSYYSAYLETMRNQCETMKAQMLNIGQEQHSREFEYQTLVVYQFENEIARLKTTNEKLLEEKYQLSGETQTLKADKALVEHELETLKQLSAYQKERIDANNDNLAKENMTLRAENADFKQQNRQLSDAMIRAQMESQSQEQRNTELQRVLNYQQAELIELKNYISVKDALLQERKLNMQQSEFKSAVDSQLVIEENAALKKQNEEFKQTILSQQERMRQNCSLVDKMIYESQVAELQMKLQAKARETLNLNNYLEEAQKQLQAKDKQAALYKQQILELQRADNNYHLVFEMNGRIEELTAQLRASTASATDNRIQIEQTRYQLESKQNELAALKASVKQDLLLIKRQVEEKDQYIERLQDSLHSLSNGKYMTSSCLEQLNHLQARVIQQDKIIKWLESGAQQQK